MNIYNSCWYATAHFILASQRICLPCILSELIYNLLTIPIFYEQFGILRWLWPFLAPFLTLPFERLLFLPFLFAKASILATVLSGLPSWVWIALAHNRLPWVAQLLSISLSILGQSSCVENIQVKQQTLSLSLSLSLSLPTIGWPAAIYLCLTLRAIANNFGHKLPALVLIKVGNQLTVQDILAPELVAKNLATTAFLLPSFFLSV